MGRNANVFVRFLVVVVVVVAAARLLEINILKRVQISAYISGP